VILYATRAKGLKQVCAHYVQAMKLGNALYSYHAYGLGIHSDLFLPELLVGIKGSADIEIKLGKIDAYLQSYEQTKKYMHATNSNVLLSYAKIASFLIIQDKQIIVDPYPQIDEQILRSWLLPHILGVLLHQRGLLVLHGSAVVIKGRAIAFLGPSGSGKSTIAASLNKREYSILADDVIAIDIINELPVIFPAFPQLKLRPDIAESLGYDLNSMQHASPTDDKLIVRLDSNFASDPIPLKRIYLLDKGKSTEICRLRPREATIELVRNSYSLVSLKAGINMSLHFSKCTKTAKDIPISRLIRGSDLKTLAAFIMAIDEDICKDDSLLQ
jgi:hypothetical protein